MANTRDLRIWREGDGLDHLYAVLGTLITKRKRKAKNLATRARAEVVSVGADPAVLTPLIDGLIENVKCLSTLIEPFYVKQLPKYYSELHISPDWPTEVQLITKPIKLSFKGIQYQIKPLRVVLKATPSRSSNLSTSLGSVSYLRVEKIHMDQHECQNAHPHVNLTGTVCWGTGNDLANELYRNWHNVTRLAAMLGELLQHYRHEGPPYVKMFAGYRDCVIGDVMPCVTCGAPETTCEHHRRAGGQQLLCPLTGNTHSLDCHTCATCSGHIGWTAPISADRFILEPNLALGSLPTCMPPMPSTPPVRPSALQQQTTASALTAVLFGHPANNVTSGFLPHTCAPVKANAILRNWSTTSLTRVLWAFLRLDSADPIRLWERICPLEDLRVALHALGTRIGSGLGSTPMAAPREALLRYVREACYQLYKLTDSTLYSADSEGDFEELLPEWQVLCTSIREHLEGLPTHPDQSDIQVLGVQEAVPDGTAPTSGITTGRVTYGASMPISESLQGLAAAIQAAQGTSHTIEEWLAASNTHAAAHREAERARLAQLNRLMQEQADRVRRRDMDDDAERAEIARLDAEVDQLLGGTDNNSRTDSGVERHLGNTGDSDTSNQ